MQSKKEAIKMTKLLDCTIRDGGHLNIWNFSEECVKETYQTAIKTGINYFEIGYRYDTPPQNCGKFAICDDDYLLTLLKPNENCKISLMIDAGKCSLSKFKECNLQNTPISIVRISTYPQKLETAFDLCEGLKQKGYEIFLNLMAISEYSQKDYEKIEKWQQKNILKSIYFADSFGSFYPSDIEHYYRKLKTIGFDKISFHSHNNLQLAFANSLKAIELGFYSIDASVFGMGRSAGNLPVELITGYMQKKYNPIHYINLIEKYYLDLFNKTPWGYNIQPLISGLKNIHPNYIKELYAKNSFSNDKIWEISDTIKEKAPISYNQQEINNLIKK